LRIVAVVITCAVTLGSPLPGAMNGGSASESADAAGCAEGFPQILVAISQCSFMIDVFD
jgi:hypothetical protein